MPRVAPSKKDAALTREEKLERCAEIAAVFRRVEEILRRRTLGTYGHMITGAVELLRNEPSALAAAQQRARFILIDEFQDANVAQIHLASILAGAARNVFAVGDPDQAIYQFRGASSEAFQEFLRRFPGTKGVVLNENQRSTSHILGCAHSVIHLNPEVDCRLAPGVDFHREPLVSARQGRAGTPPLNPHPVSIVFGDKHEEATDVAEEIRSLIESGTGTDVAILYRQHAHAAEVAYELAGRGVPAVVRGIDALQTPEGRDLLAVLGAVASLSNVEDLFRVSALPLFHLEAAQVSRCLRENRNVSYPTLLEKIPGGARVMQKIEAARTFASAAEWQAEPVCDYVMREFGFDAPAGPARRICEFVTEWRAKAITEKGTLDEFINYIGYFQQAAGKLGLEAENGDSAVVQLMTVHAAKGLEFERVYVLRANTRSFPSDYKETIFEFPQALSAMGSGSGAKQLHEEEERRLFYVALTRAKDFLSVHAKPGKSKKTPPPPPTGFLRDLMVDPKTKAMWTERHARPSTVVRIEAAAAPQSGVAAWMGARPAIIADPVLSATTIEAYDTCPLKYKLTREWLLPGPVAAALTYGNIVHTVLRGIHQAEKAARPISESDALAMFLAEMDEARFDDALQQRLYREQGVKQLSEYVRLRGGGARLPILHVENEFKVEIAGVMLRGRMDRVDQTSSGTRVVDFKTGSAYTQEKADKSLQLGIYALAARAMWGAMPRELVIYNLEDNTEVVSHRDVSELVDLEEKVQEIAAGIRESLASGEFAPNPGFHCKWCDFRDVCPATEQRLYSITRAAATN